MKKTAPYHVMEYLNDSATGIIGWVLLTPAQYRKWTGNPTSRRRLVQGYCIIATMEPLAETASVPCARLWDYHHTLAALPQQPFSEADLVPQFVMADDHPARA